MKKLLKKYFGYDTFRSQQEEIIKEVMKGNDTLVLMPTGGGKSLCFQIPALKLKGLTIVISPLISLMKDQVDALKSNGIEAEYINSTLSENQIDEIKQRILDNKIKLLYITPERLALKHFRDFIKKTKVSLIAIDEAHCISEWGHDFRPDYGNLKHTKEYFPNTPIIALTATATEKVKEDILKQLKLNEPKIFTSSFNRENLKLIIREKKNTFAQILALVEKNKDESIIIYAHSRKDVQSITEGLRTYGFKALMYHAGLSQTLRERNQEAFINDKANIMVATIAFGMGIDKSNVRLVIHNTFSKSIEGYYQEIGRAGRDNLPSECILFYTESDKRKHEFFLSRTSNSQARKAGSIKLNEMVDFCENNTCRRTYLLEYFNENPKSIKCNNCDICLNLPQSPSKIKKVEKRNLKYDKDLLKELKALRKELAKNVNLPPVNLCTDVSLREMAKEFPKTEKEFLNIKGITEKKLKDFGEEFLMLINEYAIVNDIANSLKKEIIKETPQKKKVPKKKYYKKRKHKKKK